jgi:hypothetical protein
MAGSILETTNQHFLSALVKLSEEQEIHVSEDVFSHTGMKLIARGTQVSKGLYERIVNHKLLRPLELSLSVSDGALPDYSSMGEHLFDEMPNLKQIADWKYGRVTPVGMLKELKFPRQAHPVLALAERRTTCSLKVDVLVTLLAMGIANAYRYNDAKLMAQVATAAMLHDVGELYINPAVVAQHESAEPLEWLQYSAHPVIAATVAREVIGLDPAIQRGVLEHHETLDGAGYPRGLHSDGISEIGMIVGTAALIATLIGEDNPCQRIGIALKFMPGEFNPRLVSSISELMRDVHGACDGQPASESSHLTTRIHRTLLGMGGVPETYEKLAARQRELSKGAWVMLEHFFERFVRLQRAFTSTGVAGLPKISSDGEGAEDAYFEARCVLQEIGRRCAKLARELAAKSGRDKSFTPVDQACLMEFANALAAAG